MATGRATHSLLDHTVRSLPLEPPDGWPSGEAGARMWQALRAHLDGVAFAALGREWGMSGERVKTIAYQGLAEWRRLERA